MLITLLYYPGGVKSGRKSHYLLSGFHSTLFFNFVIAAIFESHTVLFGKEKLCNFSFILSDLT